MTGARLVTTPEDLASVASRMSRESVLAVDTEAASFHHYLDRVYLIQMSSVRETVIVDPLALQDLTPIGVLLADPAIEVVFHDADYDLRSLDRDYGFRARQIFDTRIAAQLLGEPGVGLGALLQKYFGVTLDKKLQRADWSLRPLTQEMIAYAAADTSHLPALRDVLEGELQKRDRLEWAQEEFQRLEAVRWTGAETDPDEHLRLKGAKKLPPRSQLVLRALHAWREERARGLDRAPFRVLQNETLVILAQAAPVDGTTLRAVAGVPTSVMERYGGELIDVIKQSLNAPESALPRKEYVSRPRPDAETEARFERLKLMRNERARELGLEPGVLCANAALQTLAWDAALDKGAIRDRPAAVELRKWQRLALGEDRILGALAGPRAGANPTGS
jgi:ribonuclease D